MPYHCNRSKNQQQMKVLFTFLQLKLYIYVQCSYLYDRKCFKKTLKAGQSNLWQKQFIYHPMYTAMVVYCPWNWISSCLLRMTKWNSDGENWGIYICIHKLKLPLEQEMSWLCNSFQKKKRKGIILKQWQFELQLQTLIIKNIIVILQNFQIKFL